MAPKVILYAEDDPDDVVLLQRACKKAGVSLRVSIVNDGYEAINYLSGSGKYADRDQFPLPALVLLDIHMPRRSGLDVLKWIREHPALDILVVLMFTSSDLELDVYSSYRLGANGYLVKPSSPARLVELVKALNDFWLNFNQLPSVLPSPAHPSLPLIRSERKFEGSQASSRGAA